MISSGPIEDRLAIRELVDSYNDAVMRTDGEAWAENWRDDATWELPGAGPITGKANFFRFGSKRCQGLTSWAFLPLRVQWK